MSKKVNPQAQSTSGTLVDHEVPGFARANRPSDAPPTNPQVTPPASSTQRTQQGTVEIARSRHQLPKPGALDPALQLIVDPESPQSAAYRILRHQIAQSRPQVLTVTSPRMTSGKANLAVNLAIALGESGHGKVLLVDANSAQPELASILRFSPPVCFLTQLERNRHTSTPSWNVVHIDKPSLDVLAIDPSKGRSRMLDALAFGYAIDALRHGGFDHIVINAPPVLGSAEVNLVQEHTDGVILFIKRKLHTVRDIDASLKQLAPTRILGSMVGS